MSRDETHTFDEDTWTYVYESLGDWLANHCTGASLEWRRAIRHVLDILEIDQLPDSPTPPDDPETIPLTLDDDGRQTAVKED